MRAEVESVFEIACWLWDKALDEGEYLAPQKLQNLLFLTQAYYAVAFSGRQLMPGVFVAEELGPVEPSIYKTFQKGRPDVAVEMVLPEEVDSFINAIWNRFGHHSAEHLAKTCKSCAAYRAAAKKERRTEISLAAMRKSFAQAHDQPALGQVLRPKIMRSQNGKPVTVKSWAPKAIPAKK